MTAFHRLATARRTTLTLCLATALASSGAAVHHASATDANVIAVANCKDDNSGGTLREAIQSASDGDTINMTALGCSVITLQNGELVSQVPNLTLQGPGVHNLVIDGNGATRVLSGLNLTISDLTIAHGSVSDASYGACVAAYGDLSLTNAMIANCTHVNSNGGALGGAAAVLGDLTMDHASIVSSSTSGSLYASGGGAYVRGAATLSNSFVSGNHATASQSGAYGGGIFANGNVTLHATTVDINLAQSTAGWAYGGGIHSNAGDIYVLDGSVVSGNTASSDQTFAYGGGINDGTTGSPSTKVTVEASTITGNAVTSGCASCLVGGGGVHAFDSIEASYATFSYNEATCDIAASQCSTAGGAISGRGQSPSSAIVLRNATISGNQSISGSQAGAFGAGGGIQSAAGVHLKIHNSTIAFNHADTIGGGIAGSTSAGAPSELISSIVADNDSNGGAGDIDLLPLANDFVFEGSNNIVTAAAANVTLPADTSPDDPQLGPLTTDNGGVTATHALAQGSPAIDAGANPDALICDQRGSPHLRVRDGRADIGAYESIALLADGFDPPPDCS
jgi:hypothetical protein